MPANSITGWLIPSILGSCVFGLVATGCVHHSYPSARAHASAYPQSVPAGLAVHPHRDVTLVFDRSLDCHVVVGRAHHYFYRNRYYRLHDGRWQVGSRIRGPWVLVNVRDLPPRLWRRHARQLAPGQANRVRQRKNDLRLLKHRREQQVKLARSRRVADRKLAEERRAAERRLAQERLENERRLSRVRRQAEQRLGRERREAEQKLARQRREFAKKDHQQKQKVEKEQRSAQRRLVKERLERKRKLAKARLEENRKAKEDRRRTASRDASDRPRRVATNR